MHGGRHALTWLLAAASIGCGGNASETMPASGGSETATDGTMSDSTTTASTGPTSTDANMTQTTTSAGSGSQSESDSETDASASDTDSGSVDPSCDDGRVTPGEVCLELVYSYPAQDRAGDIAVGDIDGDDHLDLLIGTPQSGQISIAYGRGDGSFEAPEVVDNTANRAGVVELADLDGDGDLDVAVGDTQSAALLVYLVNAGTLGTPISNPVYVGVTDVVFERFDEGSALDVAVASGNSNHARMVQGGQTGIYDFANPQEVTSLITPTAIRAKDIDGDGDVDLVTANNGDDTISVLRNNGSGLFNSRENLNVLDQPLSIALADFDGDGGEDIVTANFNSERLTIHYSTPMGYDETTVQLNVGQEPAEVVAPDIDGDGDFDILVVTRGGNELRVFQGDGNSVFVQDERVFDLDDEPTHLAVGDFNEDTALDVAVTAEGTDRLYILLSDP